MIILLPGHLIQPICLPFLNNGPLPSTETEAFVDIGVRAFIAGSFFSKSNSAKALKTLSVYVFLLGEKFIFCKLFVADWLDIFFQQNSSTGYGKVVPNDGKKCLTDSRGDMR